MLPGLAPLPPPASWTERRKRETQRRAVRLLVAATVFHALAIPVVLIALMLYMSSALARPLTLEEVMILGGSGGQSIILFGALGQVVLALISGMGAELLARHRADVGGHMIISGVVGLAFSSIVFGGVTGMIVGGLSVAAGFLAMPSRPQTWPPSSAQ